MLSVLSAQARANNPINVTMSLWWGNADGEGAVAFTCQLWAAAQADPNQDRTFTNWDGAFTGHNDVPYDHIVVTQEWAATAHTADEAKFYWEQRWSSTSAGVANPHYNCMGYAFGQNNWVNDPFPFYENDYTQVMGLCATVDIVTYNNVQHVVVVNDTIQCCGGTVTQISFKDQSSAFFNFYLLDWDGSLAHEGDALLNFYDKK